MPDPTLADVLAEHQNADPACDRCGHVATDHPRGGACGAAGCDCACPKYEEPELSLALQYVLANRTALERFEAWRAQQNTERPAMPPEGTVAEMIHMLAYAEEPAIQYVISGNSELLNESRARACGVVAVVEEWFRDNVVALARMDWERSVRAHCNAAGSTPVIERFGDVAPQLGSHHVEIDGNGIWFAAVFAGRDWKPEVGR